MFSFIPYWVQKRTIRINMNEVKLQNHQLETKLITARVLVMEISSMAQHNSSKHNT